MHLLLTLSILSTPLLSFAEDDLSKTVETLDGCTQEKLSTPAGQKECFAALRDVKADTSKFQKQIDALQPKVTALESQRAAAKATVTTLTNPDTKLSALPSVGDANNQIPSKLGEMWRELNDAEQKDMQGRMKGLGMPQDIKQLTYAQLNTLMDDKDAKKILGCGFIDEDECDTWQKAKRDIDINRKSLLTSAQGEVAKLKVEHETQASKLKSLKGAHTALEEIKPEERAGEFFDDLNELGMLSKLALMSAQDLQTNLELGQAQLEVLKQKLGNSILGMVMDEKIDKKLEEQAATIDQQIAAKTDILEAQIEHLRGNFCREATANPICSPLEAAINNNEDAKPATSGTSGVPAADTAAAADP